MSVTIGVESEVGRGSTFWFTLPAAGRTADPGIRRCDGGDLGVGPGP